MKYIKNTIFIIFTAIIILSILFFNFWIDPFNVFKISSDLDITQIPRDHYHIILKAYKNQSADTVVLGSSSTHSLFFRRNYYQYFFNLLCRDHFSYEQQYNLLKDYLHFHPETKKVYIFVTYPSFYEDCSEPVSKFDGDKLNFQDMMFLLFSKEITQRSIDSIKHGKLNQYLDMIIDNYRRNIKNLEWLFNVKFKKDIKLISNNYNYEKPSIKNFDFTYFPNIVPASVFDKNENNIKSNLEYLRKMAELLKEKNIDMHIVLHPYHALYLSILAKDQFMQETINEIKRVCVQISDNDVYDFSVINKYTASDYVHNNYLYRDLIHPNYVLGMKVFKVLHDNISEDGLYLKLNKKNIEQQIKISNEKINKYMTANSSLVDSYINFYNNKPNIDLHQQNIKNFDGAPKYITQELEIYLEQEEKINSLYGNRKQIKLGTWENKF